MKRLILLLVLLALAVSCSERSNKNYIIEELNGIKVYKNSNKPSVEDVVITPREIFTISGMDKSSEGADREFIWPHFLDIDSRGNIFIVDTASASIKKFDKSGVFVKSFGSKGSGPGEMIYPFMINVLNDIIFVADFGGQRMVKFDTQGNFIDNLVIKSRFPNYIQAVGKEKFVCFRNHIVRTDENPSRSLNLVLVNKEFQEIATLLEFKLKVDPNSNDLLDLFTAYTVGNDKIFVAENSEDRYKINVFDFNGRLLYSIEKEYTPVEFAEFELNELNSTLEAMLKKFGNPNFQPIRAKFKKSINTMYYDKEGRLLVCSSVKRDEGNRYDLLIDVFKEGVFLKKIKLSFAKGFDFLKLYDEKMFFKGNRIYHLDVAAAVIKVFEY